MTVWYWYWSTGCSGGEGDEVYMQLEVVVDSSDDRDQQGRRKGRWERKERSVLKIKV
jgi:hypothetical protein